MTTPAFPLHIKFKELYRITTFGTLDFKNISRLPKHRVLTWALHLLIPPRKIWFE